MTGVQFLLSQTLGLIIEKLFIYLLLAYPKIFLEILFVLYQTHSKKKIPRDYKPITHGTFHYGFVTNKSASMSSRKYTTVTKVIDTGLGKGTERN